jgi:membrane protease YdiL (CAAX protease family)
LDWLRFNGNAVMWGVFATVPLCVVFLAAYLRPIGSYRRIKDLLLESLGPSLAACRWYELLLVAALAGIGEELLFRGTVQTWMERWGYPESLLISNVVFALCHAITFTYAVLAFVMGIVLGLLLDAPGERSLLAPMLTHGLYDYFAFWVLAVDWRRRQQAVPNEEKPDEAVLDEGRET